MRKASDFNTYVTEQDININSELGQQQDQYDQIMREIKNLWKNVNAIGGEGINKVGVQTNIKKQIAEKYKLLANAMISLADAEFNKAKYDENVARKEKQEKLT